MRVFHSLSLCILLNSGPVDPTYFARGFCMYPSSISLSSWITSWAMRDPGYKAMSASPRFISSRVRVPVYPGLTRVAVAIIKPSRPHEERPIT